jgi:hypothetical protein
MYCKAIKNIIVILSTSLESRPTNAQGLDVEDPENDPENNQPHSKQRPQIRLPATHEPHRSTQKSMHTCIDGKKSKRRGALSSHWSSGTNNRRNTATRETLAWNEPTGKSSQNKGPRRLSRKTVNWHVTLPIISFVASLTSPGDSFSLCLIVDYSPVHNRYAHESKLSTVTRMNCIM